MPNRLACGATASLFLLLSACSSAPGRQTKVYQTGEKAAVDKLTYSVIDTQIHPRLGDDPNSPRIPQNRFYVIQISVSSGANADMPIPSLTLVDDAGKTYTEIPDGSGLQHWLGVVRSVSPAQTERGEILFDAPAAHYKLKLSDETDADDVFIDLPLNFVHEQMGNEPAGLDAAPPPDAPVSGPGAPPPAKKK
jgi:hypothetical protein